MDIVLDVVDLMEMYQLSYGTEVCAFFLEQNLDENNFLFTLQLASLYNLIDLKLFCETAAPFLISSERLQTCSKHELFMFLKIDSLQTKLNLIECSIKWKENHIEEHINFAELFQKIKFKALSTKWINAIIDDFSEYVTKQNILEMAKSLTNRISLAQDDILVSTVVDQNEMRNIKSIEAIMISSNTIMLLKGILIGQIFDPYGYHQQFYGLLELSEDTSNDIILRESMSFIAPNPYIHFLESPILLKPNRVYTLKMQLAYEISATLTTSIKMNDDLIGADNLDITWTGESVISSLIFGV